MFRFAHLSDLHPNSSATYAGKTMIDPATGKNQSLTDMSKSLEFVFRVAMAKETRCQGILLPGDVFDSVKPTMDEVQVILQWLEAMADEMPVVICLGNHDMAVSPSMATALEPLKWRSNVFVMERPGSIVLNLDGQHVRVFALPYPAKGRLLANESLLQASPEEVTAVINHALATILRGFRAEFEPGIPNLLLAHGSVANCKVNDQPRSLAHDILIPLDELQGFDYCALGHIHQGQSVAQNVWYSGSLMRNGFGEEKEPKGFNLVSLEPGQPANVAFIHNPHARVYKTLKAVDIDDDLLATPLDPSIVWRFKDQLIAEDYQNLKPILDELQAATPFFQVDVELVGEDRARDAGMAQCLTMEDALTRALAGTIEEAEIPSVFEKHQQLVQEVSA